MSLKEAVFQADDIGRKPAPVPGWPDGLFVKKITAKELELYREEIHGKMEKKPDGTYDVTDDALDWIRRCAYWVAVSFVDKDGCRVFDPSDPEDIAQLMNKSVQSLEIAAGHAIEINGLGIQGETGIDLAKKN